MRPPRLILLAFCLIFLPIFLTFFSALSSSRVATPNAIAGPTTGLHALFSFNIPSSLFPPSAIISLTDDNSTFFLARPAAFGPLLPEKGLSGQLWVGAGFGESGPTVGVAGELGCSDIPGWGEGDSHHNQDKPNPAGDKAPGKSGSSEGDGIASTNLRRNVDSPHDSELQSGGNDELSSPPTNDGTDDHLHHPLPQSGVVDNSAEKRGESGQAGQAAHADIQSLQESAEIAGKIVLLSRGGCGFLEKAKWVQRRGGVALIVGDDTRGGGLVTMYARGDTSNVTIPALFTSHTTAQLLSSLMPPQTAEDPSLRTRPKASHTRPPSQSSVAKHGPSAIGSAIPTRSATPHTDKSTQVDSKGKTGIFNSVLSLLGLGSGRQTWPPTEDSRRPPSSGNIDWVVLGSWDEEETSLDGLKDSVDLSHVRSKPSSIPGGSKKAKSKATGADGDGFVIGVQDWRDPDAMAPKSSVHPAPSMTRRSQTNEKGSGYSPTPLKGGSRTPGSGEYQNVEEPSSSKEAVAKGRQSAAAFQSAPPAPGKNWFSRHFAWTEEKEPDADQSSIPRGEPSNTDETKRRGSSSAQNHRIIKSSDHKGLWVTLTPTSMSTSPFFDTLLVLVVSPLLTLTVVYALLLLRARIRRRRWRAPKSVVDRLPVRTYHTIARSSSPSSSSSRRSDRAESPSPALPTSPLLGSASRSSGSRSRPRSQTMSGFVPGSAGSSNVELSSKEKPAQGPSVWKRKYTGRQVECVVCLEEYVDGQSRVMSLPCGHEFHAECITPWLTTRRRTCPICKGDVVRSTSYSKSRAEPSGSQQPSDVNSYQGASSAPVPISGLSEDEMSDTEHHAESDTGLLEGQSSSAPPSNWRNLASLSFSVLSGDTIWHQPRTDRNR